MRAADAVYAAAMSSPRRASLGRPKADGLGIAWALAAVDRLYGAEPAVAAGSRALTAAARATGVDLAYLHRTAQAESSLNPFARAPTSSARGLFQFVDQTWLLSVAKWGARHGRSAEASLIRLDRRGRAYVVDPAQRRAILGLRYDPDLSALMAAELARENAGVLGAVLQRPATARELYAAHLLGVGDAVRLIRAAERTPGADAAALLPAAAARNGALFFQAGKPRTAAALLQRLP